MPFQFRRFFPALFGCLTVLLFAGAASAQEIENTPDVAVGERVVLTAEVGSGAGPFNYQWYKNGAPISGAVNAALVFAAIQPDDGGEYAVLVWNEAGSTASLPETLNVVATRIQSRLANVSIVSSSGESLVVGFALGGSGTLGSSRVLARAAGPALAQLGVSQPLTDPTLSVFDRGNLVAANDDWGSTEILTHTVTAVGAFPFPMFSKDAAVVVDLARASYTAVVKDGSGGKGATVMEVYDTITGPVGTTPRLVNISARGTVGAETGALTAGFTVQGEAPLRVLIRGVGPGLALFDVPGALASPRLALFRQSEQIGGNEGWSNGSTTEMAAAASAVGAFALAEKSADAAMLVTLKPGSYTAQLSALRDGAGLALIEIYEVP
jgi:hypothetical protein